MNFKAVTRNIQNETKKINYLSSGGINNNKHNYNSLKNLNQEQNTIDNSILAQSPIPNPQSPSKNEKNKIQIFLINF